MAIFADLMKPLSKAMPALLAVITTVFVAQAFGEAPKSGWQANGDLVEALGKKRASYIYDEARVPAYKLPDPLVSDGGVQVKNPKEWAMERRPFYSKWGHPKMAQT